MGGHRTHKECERKSEKCAEADSCIVCCVCLCVVRGARHHATTEHGFWRTRYLYSICYII